MPARARSDDADAVRVDIPFRGMGPGEVHGASGIVHHDGVMVARRGEPAAQHNARNSMLGKPKGVALTS
jgi:hypothetical protein